MDDQTTISKDEAVNALWRAGILDFKLHKTQLEMMQAYRNLDEGKLVICCSRQLGKSYFLACLAISEALKTPHCQIKYACPTQKMARKICHPLFRQILQDIPEDIRPDWKLQEGIYLFKNGSQIDISGTDSGSAESLRGTRMHLGIYDEAGFADDLEYVIKDIFLPMTLTTGGKIVMASTPAKIPRHPFETYYRDAAIDKRAVHKTIFDNPLITPERIEAFMKESGGATSTTWRREFLAEFVIDEQLVVIPEFTPELEKEVVKEVERPIYCDKYVAMDVGTRDLTAILFGYWDFKQALLVIEDEIVLKGSKQVRTDLIAEHIKNKEKQLWNAEKPYFRVADNELLLINDLHHLHGIQFVPTDKDQKEAAVNELRLMLQHKRVIIHPRCETTISHLKYAVWDNEKKTFARIAEFAHFDCIDALVYMLRNVRRTRNPYPNESYPDSMHVVKQSNISNNKTVNTFNNMFKRPKQ